MVHYEYWCAVTIYPISALESRDPSTHKSPTTVSPSHAFQIHISKHISEPHVVLHKMQSGLRDADAGMKVKEGRDQRERCVTLCNRWAFEPARDKHVPNKRNPPCTQLERCAYALAFQQMRKATWEKRGLRHILLFLFSWVCLPASRLSVSGSSLSPSQGTAGLQAPLLVPSPPFCLLPSPGSSSTPAPWAGQRFLSNRRQRQSLTHSLFASPCRAPTRSLHLGPEQLT